MIQKRGTSGRTRTFSEPDVLGAAMDAFRRGGYGGVSVRDLEAATGLSAGSIYNAYGDKAGLFTAALAHYNRTVLAGRIARHAPVAAGVAGLQELFRSLAHEPDGGSAGCLITNTAVELGDDPDTAPLVAEGLATLRRTFVDRLEVARATGDLPGTIDPELTALVLLGLYQGILVLVRAGWDPGELDRLVDAQFASLGGRHAR